MLTIQELRSATQKELLQELGSSQKALLELRIGTRTKHHKDTSGVGKTKRYIARIKTALKEAELEEAVKTAAKID